MVTVPHLQQDACFAMVRKTLRSSFGRSGPLWCDIFCAEIPTVSPQLDQCAEGALVCVRSLAAAVRARPTTTASVHNPRV